MKQPTLRICGRASIRCGRTCCRNARRDVTPLAFSDGGRPLEATLTLGSDSALSLERSDGLTRHDLHPRSNALLGRCNFLLQSRPDSKLFRTLAENCREQATASPPRSRGAQPDEPEASSTVPTQRQHELPTPAKKPLPRLKALRVGLRPKGQSRQFDKSQSKPVKVWQEQANTAANLGKSKTLAPLPKLVFKAEKGPARSTGLKRNLSLDELQPQLPQRTSSGTLILKTGPKRLLHRLTLGPPIFGEKSSLPVLAPMEKKILASVGEREWVKIDKEGNADVLKRDKHAVTHELGIQIRDLRLLDPLMTSSYPSCILCRDKALVVNLEYIKCIITTTYMLIMDVNRPVVQGFIQHLRERLQEGSVCKLGEQERLISDEEDRASSHPFELQALEAALEEVSRHLENLCLELEFVVRPMVGVTAAGKVTSDYLERLRRVKSRLVRLRTRVETLKEVLEKYLDSEDDLRSMHLSKRLREQKANALRRLVRQSLKGSTQPSSATRATEDSAEACRLLAQDEAVAEGERAVEEVEMLLEGYYMNLDSTWNKLVDIAEMLDDAEELMDLEMDTYRNNIIKMKVFLGACHLLAGTLWAISNIFGMNVGLVQDDLQGDTYDKFVEVSVISCGGCLLLMILLNTYLHKHRLAVTTITT